MTDMSVEVGKSYRGWKVLEILPKARAKCVCLGCGVTERSIKRSDLVRGRTAVCMSCSRTHTSARRSDAMYSTWVGMVQRCHNPRNKDYKNYGARGITVCDLWRESFDAWYMSMGQRPEGDYTLERIDVNKGYEPGNVTWLPRAEQPLNQRSNVHLTVNGKTLLVSQWPDEPECTVTKAIIYKRLYRGWEHDEAVLAPNGYKKGQWRKENGDN